MIEVSKVEEDYFRCNACGTTEEDSFKEVRTIRYGDDIRSLAILRICSDCSVQLIHALTKPLDTFPQTADSDTEWSPPPFFHMAPQIEKEWYTLLLDGKSMRILSVLATDESDAVTKWLVRNEIEGTLAKRDGVWTVDGQHIACKVQGAQYRQIDLDIIEQLKEV